MSKYQAYSEYKDSGVEWISEIPAQWSSMSFGKAVQFMGNGASATQIEENKDTVRVTRIETISAGVINLDKVGHVRRFDISPRFRLQRGDIQFSNINSLSMVGNCAIFVANEELFSGMNLLHIRPDYNRVHSKYMLYQLKTKWFRNSVEANAKPAINQASIPTGTLKQLGFLCPSLVEQEKIANFLDHETAKIDTLIDKQQQLIQLLKEKRQAVISHAVTKGLNPNAPMRDSGVEWLGEVPEHWEMTRAKFVSNIFIPQRNKPELNDAEGTAWVTMENMKTSYIENTSLYVSRNASKVAGSKKLKKDSVIASCVGNFGVAAINKVDVIINQQLQAFIPFAIKAEYLRELVAMSTVYFELVGTAATLTYVNQEGFENLPVLVPPANEQKKICIYLEAENMKFENLIDKAQSAIQLMQERRTALISAAVTGKIDVSHWQVPAPMQSKEAV
ncbi:MAG: restriction endonuclease subunit S [Pseudomonas sp.]|nr:restriction endonuclease subunit S [Pseudomonas sp.]